jgi:hypothetical protein
MLYFIIYLLSASSVLAAPRADPQAGSCVPATIYVSVTETVAPTGSLESWVPLEPTSLPTPPTPKPATPKAPAIWIDQNTLWSGNANMDCAARSLHCSDTQSDTN